jgi:hypothetical protein
MMTSFTSTALITSAHVGGYDANSTNTVSSTLEFALYIPDDEIALLARKSRALHKFHKEMRRSPRGCFDCGNTTNYITDCSMRKKFDPLTSMTTPTGMTTATKATTRRTTSETTRRRSSKRSFPERVLP